ncbi:pantoate--beta-alanine ligase [Flaviaesturariibacter flavus]|uniref:Pantothenate synthetase n=1 Tax=Flaviaesturariibacter flavus TaxID=2502780 RepID=A0A4R1BPR3_9BACT|nr:pantoate--beta-alanine ligase [Flaviaesturariibacter flavus]TCJ19225.1 pantoate--beta-alanine ligase [Flaviaesturariibacter flavus]
MYIFKTARDLSEFLSQSRAGGQTIGFVPTMGALHPGHLSLIREARAANAVTVCSIFVNPTQFNNPDDFTNYPSTIDADVEQLLTAGCDVLFLPPVAEVYPAGHVKRHYDLGPVETVLEGAFRPGHFQGVCQVVDRLLDLVAPDRLYLGQKDFQQCMVVRRLLELTGRQGKTELVIVPTMREEDGLAMSSRNLRLSPAQRSAALALSRALDRIRTGFDSNDNRALEQAATESLRSDGFRVDYVAICAPETLLPLENKQKPAVALIAATIGPVRLIDNMVIE